MPVTNPTAGDVHVNTPLTNFGQKYLLNASQFIASRAMPNMPVSKQSDLYYEFNKADFLRDEATARADGTESAGGGFRLSTSPYYANVYAFHKDVTDRQRANQDNQVRLDQSATQWVTQKLLIRREILFQESYFTPGLWETDITPAAGDKWDTATGDPIAQIRLGKRTVQGTTGFRPNKLIIGRSAYDGLLDNDAILARITGGATTTVPALVMKQKLTELLELDEIYKYKDLIELDDKATIKAIICDTNANSNTLHEQFLNLVAQEVDHKLNKSEFKVLKDKLIVEMKAFLNS